MKFFIFALLLSSFYLTSAQTYYVSSSQGNDSNTGTSENSPYKSISKVNTLNLNPGDKILFKRGDVWQGEILNVKNSGISTNEIMIGNYGNGVKPILTLRQPISGWNNQSNWENRGDGSWRMTIPYNITDTNPIDRLWINGKEVYFAFNGSQDADGRPSQNPDGTIGINSNWEFYSVSSNRILQIYSVNNPASEYSNIEYPGGNSGDYTIRVYGDYVTIDGLDIEGGMRGSVGLDGADYVSIKNCDIGKYSNWVGIEGNSTSYSNPGNDKTSDNCIIENNTVYSDWKYQYYSYTARTPYGIYIGNGASNWIVRNNYIKDWWMEIFGNSSDNYGISYNIQVYNNEITSPDFAFTKGIEIECGSGPTTSNSLKFTRWKIYNNYIHDIKSTGIQIGASGNYIFFNIVSNIFLSTSAHQQNAYGIYIFPDDDNYGNSDSNLVFNNTLTNIEQYGIFEYGRYTQWFNNLLVNTGTKLEEKLAVVAAKGSNDLYRNNLYFYTGLNKSAIMYQINNILSVNYSNWAALNGNYTLTITNENQYTGNLSDLIDMSDFTLPNESPALNAGKDISNLMSSGFQDRYGNSVNRQQPNIGAVAGQAIQSTGFRVFLEGPYKDAQMATTLNDNGDIPKSQPYNDSPWNYNGNESVSTVPRDVVDWVLVELRSAISSSSAVARKAAFLRNDGSITDLDGVSPIKFDNTSLLGIYYIVVKHRNHLAIMSSLPAALINSNIQYDFTTSESKAYGQSSMADLGDGSFGMYGGDTDGNGIIEDKDYMDVSQKLFSSGYIQEDSDMNSSVNVLDYKLSKVNLSKSTNVK